MSPNQPQLDPFLDQETSDQCREAYFIKRLGGFGDVVMALGAINAIRKARRGAEVHFLTETRYAPLARLCPHVHVVHSDAKDFMIAMQDRTTSGWKVVICEWQYAFSGINKDHQIDAFLKGAGFYAASKDKEAILHFEPKAEEALAQKVRKLLPSRGGRRILLHPSRGDANRTWPRESWDRLIELITQHGHIPILVGDNSSIPFKGVLRPSPRPEIVDLTNKLSFLELMTLCREADVFVSPDSGPVQVAGTTDIGLVALYTTVPARCRLPFRNGYHMWKAIGLEPTCPHKGCYQILTKSGPWMDKLQNAFRKDFVKPGSQATNTFMGEFCVLESQPKHACLQEITPEAVWDACQKLLDVDDETLAASIASAQEAMNRGHYGEAIPILRACLEAFYLPDLELDLASALIQSGDFPGAFKVLDETLKRHPSSDLFNLMAMATYLEDYADEAERLGDLATGWNPFNISAQANLALIRAHKAFENNAFLDGLFALKEHFIYREKAGTDTNGRMLSEETAQILKGYLTIGLSQSHEAVSSFSRAVELNPESVLAAQGLADAYFGGGLTELAINWYQRALELDPTFQLAAARLNELGHPGAAKP